MNCKNAWTYRCGICNVLIPGQLHATHGRTACFLGDANTLGQATGCLPRRHCPHPFGSIPLQPATMSTLNIRLWSRTRDHFFFRRRGAPSRLGVDVLGMRRPEAAWCQGARAGGVVVRGGGLSGPTIRMATSWRSVPRPSTCRTTASQRRWSTFGICVAPTLISST